MQIDLKWHGVKLPSLNFLIYVSESCTLDEERIFKIGDLGPEDCLNSKKVLLDKCQLFCFDTES